VKQLAHLYWVLTSPSMLNPAKAPFTLAPPFSEADIAQIMRHAETELASHMQAQKSHFLGAYFESLWRFALKHSTRYSLKVSGLQVHHQGKTLGELDFIVYDHLRECYVHQEVAIKFYLGIHPSDSPETLETSFWIGPQCVDRLDLKVSYMHNKQLPLAQHPIVQQRLKELDISDITSEGILKGFLFSPMHGTPPDTPSYVNTECLQGKWLRYKSLPHYAQHCNTHTLWCWLEKQDWISDTPAVKDTDHPLMTTAALLDTLEAQIGQAPTRMLIQMERGHDGQLVTKARLFVVSGDWPTPHTAPPL